MSLISEIKDKEIEEAKKVLSNHIVKRDSPESFLESLIFCIASQATPWERASAIVYHLRDESYPGQKDARFKFSSLEIVSNPEKVEEIAKNNEWRFHHQKRFSPAIEFYRNIGNLPVEKLKMYFKEIKNADSDYREDVVGKIKYVSRKTFSFWHLCLGGKNLLPLDVHIRRQLSELGVEMNSDYYTLKRRKTDGQRVVRELDKKEYLRIESKALELFSQDKRFKNGNDKVDVSFVSSLLWWRGARRENCQMNLFGDMHEIILPYGLMVN